MKRFLVLILVMLTACTPAYEPEISDEVAERDDQVSTAYCLIIGSYHEGYEGQDQLYAGIANELEGYVEYELISMDTRNNPDTDFAEAKALDIHQYIEESNPDIMIAMDDNASKYLVMPYYKDASLPIVFIGVNWSVEAYGYPYSNVTGMIESHPIRQAVDQLFDQIPEIATACCIYPDTESDRVHNRIFTEALQEYNIETTSMPVTDYASFKKIYEDAQEYDLIYFTNYYGIESWDEENGRQWVYDHTSSLTFTTNSWMNSMVALGFNMDSYEQGSYAGMVVKSVLLDHQDIASIPIVTNQQYKVVMNQTLLNRLSYDFSSDFDKKATKITP